MQRVLTDQFVKMMTQEKNEQTETIGPREKMSNWTINRRKCSKLTSEEESYNQNKNTTLGNF